MQSQGSRNDGRKRVQRSERDLDGGKGSVGIRSSPYPRNSRNQNSTDSGVGLERLAKSGTKSNTTNLIRQNS